MFVLRRCWPIHRLLKIGVATPYRPAFSPEARAFNCPTDAMTDKPATTYIVSVFDMPHWRKILTSSDKGEAEALEQAMVQDEVKTRIEEITPKPKKR
jgi:hypothetical protein